jgi:hypothetical protein
LPRNPALAPTKETEKMSFTFASPPTASPPSSHLILCEEKDLNMLKNLEGISTQGIKTHVSLSLIDHRFSLFNPLS